MKIAAVRVWMVAPEQSFSALHAIDEPDSASPLDIYPQYRGRSGLWRGSAQAPIAVEIASDEGVTGAISNWGGGPPACAIIEGKMAPWLVGRNPIDVDALWESLYTSVMRSNFGAPAFMALSAVEKALWDLKGKILGQPVYRLLGGPVRDGVPVYASGRYVDAYLVHRFAGYKIPVPRGPVDGRAGVAENLALLRWARDLIGPQASLMVECYMGWTVEYTLRLAPALRELGVAWIEDPLLPDDYEGYAMLRRKAAIPIAVGNLLFGVEEFAEVVRRRACDILQPPIEWCGGLLAVRRLCALAGPAGITVIPHADSVFAYHLVAAIAECPMAEYIFAYGDRRTLGPMRPGIIKEPLPENGTVRLSEAPGFGIGLDRGCLRPWCAIA